MQDERLTVVIVNDFAHVNGGATQVALSSAVELARRGHFVILFCAVGPADPLLEKMGIHIVCTDQPDLLSNPSHLKAAVQGIWNRTAATEMTVLLSRVDPRNTVIHVHSWTKALSASVIQAAIAHNTGILVTVHDYFMGCPNGCFYDHAREEICNVKPLSATCVIRNCDSRSYLQKLWRLARQQVQMSFGNLPGDIHHFITNSQLARSVIAPYLPAHAELYHIQNPISVTMGCSTDTRREDSLVFIGRIASEKGPLIAAEAARRTKSKLRFIGDGPLKERLRTQYPEFAVSGWVSREEIETQLTRSRALVFPSLWYETQGLVVLEAAARGIPAIVADTSAAREWVIDGETGLWFRGGDVDDLSEKLLMIRDDDLVRRLGSAAHSRFWASPPTIEKHVDALEACYRKVLMDVKTDRQTETCWNP